MDINRNNYEIFFLDYLDGTLDPQMEKQLMAFLDENPDLREELDGLEQCRVIEETPVHFKEKNLLRKKESFTAAQNEERIIAFYEGDLSPQEQAALLSDVGEDSELRKVFEMFSKTVLSADRSVSFDRKDLLRKPEGASVLENELAAMTEGDLPEDREKILMTEMKKNASLQHEFEIMTGTVLKADTAIVFKDKRSLKHFEISRPVVWRYVAAAATIALLTGLFFLLRPSGERQDQKMAGHDNGRIPAVTLNGKGIHQDTVKPEKNRKEKEFIPHVPVNPDREFYAWEKISNRKAILERVNKDAGNLKEIPVTYSPEMFPKDELLADNNTPVQKDLNFGTFLFHKAANALANEPEEASNITKNRRRLNFWDFAFLGVKGYNRVFNKDVKLHPSYDENGNLSSVDFKAGKMAYSKTFNK